MQVEIIGLSKLYHSSQVYTGLERLSKLGEVKLSYVRASCEFHQYCQPKGVLLTVDDYLCFIDLLDGSEIDQKIKENVNFYFKRSLNENDYGKPKLHPYGLNYEVYNNTPNFPEIKRLLSLNMPNSHGMKNKLSCLLDAIGVTYIPRVKDFEKDRRCEMHGEHKILFMARTWDPNEKGISLTEREREDRRVINEERSNIIRALKKEFRGSFLGGFSKTDYSLKYYKDCVIEDPKLSKKINYLDLVRRIPICIATTGLHGSLGWKLSEYVALGRAIISEKSSLIIPYGFLQKNNYLSYESSGDCLAKVHYLLGNPDVMRRMMENNIDYYNRYLKPEKIISNLLSVIKNDLNRM